MNRIAQRCDLHEGTTCAIIGASHTPKIEGVGEARRRPKKTLDAGEYVTASRNFRIRCSSLTNEDAKSFHGWANTLHSWADALGTSRYTTVGNSRGFVTGPKSSKDRLGEPAMRSAEIGLR
jgi:hypothetical protein